MKRFKIDLKAISWRVLLFWGVKFLTAVPVIFLLWVFCYEISGDVLFSYGIDAERPSITWGPSAPCHKIIALNISVQLVWLSIAIGYFILLWRQKTYKYLPAFILFDWLFLELIRIYGLGTTFAFGDHFDFFDEVYSVCRFLAE